MFTGRRAETLGALALASFGASAADRQALDDAWWTGPILAAVVGNEAADTTSNSGNTFPSSYNVLGRMYSLGVNMSF